MKRSTVIGVAALLVAGAAWAGAPVSPAEVAKRIQDAKTAPFVLDVRTAGEFADGHVPGAVNVPVQDLEANLAKVPKDRDVVVYCESGRRASRAGALLAGRGYASVSEMEGSMKAWRAAGLPIEK